VSSWDACLALLLTALVLILCRVSKNPKIQRGDKVLVDLCLGLVAVGASCNVASGPRARLAVGVGDQTNGIWVSEEPP
jgi:hypothetical protein